VAGLPVVLVFAPHPVHLESPPSSRRGEGRDLDCRWHASDARLKAILARERPAVIVSFGDRAAYPRLQAAPHSVRRRWLHVDTATPSAGDLERVGAMVFCLFLHRVLGRDGARLDGGPPLVSVFTPTWRSGPRIHRAYRSLRTQTYDHWEWVVLDDSDDGGVTIRAVEEIAREEPRLSLHTRPRRSGRIGEVKRQACALSRGAILVELDHDDELTPHALSDIVEAFRKDPQVGLVYSDWATIDEQSGASLTYGDSWAFGFGGYRSETHDGRTLTVATAPPINAYTIRHIVGTPNHVRAWRRDVYWQVGGHNADLHVADDYELLVRTFLATRMSHIPRLCYIQHYRAGSSTHDVRRAEIQRLVRCIQEHYERQIHGRLEELGLPDPLWAGSGSGGRAEVRGAAPTARPV
jgi:glycosyltransferase involved in cell wall biosynthesis